MEKKFKRYLAWFMALAMLASYSFSPQNLTAFAVSGTDKAMVAEEQADTDKATEEANEDKTTESENATNPEEESVESSSAEAEFPATSFEADVDGVHVMIDAPEGALPEGTTADIKPVKAQKIEDAVQDLYENAEVVKAVDITFLNKEGKEIEPNKTVAVSFKSSAFKGLDNAAVVHVDDEGTATDVSRSKVDTAKKTASFKSKDFSIYAVVETGDDARLLVKFMGLDEEIASMYVKKGDNMEQVVYDPGAGELPDGAYFRGWTTDEDYTTEKIGRAHV